MKTLCEVLGVLLVLSGCTATSTTYHYDTANLPQFSDRDITVTTKSGRVITFKEGEYTVLTADSGMIKGRGKHIVNSFDLSSPDWEGTIPFSDITSYTTTSEGQTSGPLTVLLVISGVMLVAVISASHL